MVQTFAQTFRFPCMLLSFFFIIVYRLLSWRNCKNQNDCYHLKIVF